MISALETAGDVERPVGLARGGGGWFVGDGVGRSATGRSASWGEAGARTTKNPRLSAGVGFEALGDDLLLHGLSHTTIGAGAFHFRVRDGIGWDHTAMVAKELAETAPFGALVSHRGLGT